MYSGGLILLYNGRGFDLSEQSHLNSECFNMSVTCGRGWLLSFSLLLSFRVHVPYLLYFCGPYGTVPDDSARRSFHFCNSRQQHPRGLPLYCSPGESYQAPRR